MCNRAWMLHTQSLRQKPDSKAYEFKGISTLSGRDMQALKCVVVGDGAVGKTCMLISYVENKFPSDYIPTVFDHFAVNVLIEGKSYTIGLFDTAGQEEFDKLRPLAYPGSDIILVCFSIVSPTSYNHVRDKWVPEIKHYCEKTPFLIVGTQADLRDNLTSLGKEKLISIEMGEKLAKDLKAIKYVECSALTQKGLKNVFDQASRAALKLPPTVEKRKKCAIL